MKAIILAAGLGTRLKPFTDTHPKALAVVSGKTLLQRNIEYLKSFGIQDIIINVHHFSGQILSYLAEHDNFNTNISISDESGMLLETGGALKKAEWFLKDSDPFLMMNADILTNLNISAFINKHISSAAMVTLAVTDRKTSRYFLFNRENRLAGWKNTATGEQTIIIEGDLTLKAFSGIHLISPDIFRYLNKITEQKFSIIKPYLQLTKSSIISSFDHSGDTLIDVGKPDSLIAAEKLFLN